MKLFKGLISIFLLLTIVSCATTEKESESMVPEEMGQETDNKKMVEEKTEETIYFVTKEEVFYGDGQIDTLTTYTYNDDFDLISRIETNEQGEVLESFFNTIKDGKLVRRDNFGFGNVLNNYFIYEYDMNSVISETMYDDEDKIQTINNYEYENNNLAVWRTLGPNGGTLAITEYEYDKYGNNTSVNIKDALGSIDGVIEKTYNDHLLVEEKILDANGELEKSTQYIYDGDILVEKVYFDKRGKKKRSESYEFELNKPVPSRVNLLYNSGDIDIYTLYEYDSEVITKTVLVEE